MPEKEELPKLDVPEEYQPYKDVSLDRNHPDMKLVEIIERTTEEKVDYLISKFALITHKLNILEEQRKKFNWCGSRDDLNTLTQNFKDFKSKSKVLEEWDWKGIIQQSIGDNALKVEKEISELREYDIDCTNQLKRNFDMIIELKESNFVPANACELFRDCMGNKRYELRKDLKKLCLMTYNLHTALLPHTPLLKKLTIGKSLMELYDKLDGEKEEVGTEGSKLDAGSIPKAQNQVRTSSKPSEDEWVLVKKDGTTEIYGAKYFKLVRKEHLKEISNRLKLIRNFIKANPDAQVIYNINALEKLIKQGILNGK